MRAELGKKQPSGSERFSNRSLPLVIGGPIRSSERIHHGRVVQRRRRQPAKTNNPAPTIPVSNVAGSGWWVSGGAVGSVGSLAELPEPLGSPPELPEPPDPLEPVEPPGSPQELPTPFEVG